MTDNRYGDAPLGKSVEEVESESSNVVNSSVSGEAVRAEDQVVIPAVVSSNASGIPAVINRDVLVERDALPDDGSNDTTRHDTSET